MEFLFRCSFPTLFVAVSFKIKSGDMDEWATRFLLAGTGSEAEQRLESDVLRNGSRIGKHFFEMGFPRCHHCAANVQKVVR